ncbi:MAG: nuclear transport factor 2 family protein [Caldilineales bacterium]|nr:nuclear transport factor 2 family protein [Caldilineales bacterium]
MSPIRMSKIEDAMRTVLAFNEAFNRHDVSGMMALMSEDCIFESPEPAPDGTRYAGKDTVTQYWLDFFQASPAAHITIEEIFGLGLRCVMRWRYEWIDEAGHEGHVRGVDVFKMKGGLICEKLSYVKG